MRGRTLSALVVVAAVAASAYVIAGRHGRRKPAPNVILVVADTLRADRLAAYGGRQHLTPFLDELATQGTVYEHAYAASSWTIPSITSLFLAQFPSEHQVVLINAVLPESDLTLAEVFQQHGFRTAGFSANVQIAKENGFGQGFDEFQVLFHEPKDDAETVNAAALHWLDTHPSDGHPLLLYLQYMEPHAPYRLHPGITAPAPPGAGLSDDELMKRLNDGNFALGSTHGPAEAWRFTPPQTQRIEQLYDGEVAHLDSCLRSLFAALDRRGMLRNAIVVVTADHGEEFGKQGLYGHGYSLFQPEIHVPLLIHVPGRVAGRISNPVQLAGLGPVLLRLAGLPLPPSFHVAPIPLFEPALPQFAYSELLKTRPDDYRLQRRALVSRRAKVMETFAGTRLFYDLSNDPAETRPLTTGPFAPALLAALDRVTAQLVTGARVAEPPTPDSATRERLHALGYAN